MQGAPRQLAPDLTSDHFAAEYRASHTHTLESIEDGQQRDPPPAGSGGDGSDTSDDDHDQYGVRQALPVDDAPPDWAAGPPTTPEEYLRRVRHEASQLPNVMTSGIDPRAYDGARTALRLPGDAAAPPPETPPFARPRREWIRQFLEDFEDLRDELQCEDDIFESGIRAPRALSEMLAHTGLADARAAMPTVQLLRSFDQVTTVRYLRQRIVNVNSSSSLSEEDAVWLYGLLARLERPLSPDMCASLQQLHRSLLRMRSVLPDLGAPALPRLNIVIVICGAVFGQDEKLAPLYEG